MAKRNPTGKDNRRTMEQNSFRLDDTTNEVWRAVCDEVTHEKLDEIVDNLGGTSDTNVTIFNIIVPTKNIEQSQQLPSNTKTFFMRSRNKGNIKVAYTQNQTDTNFITVVKGSVYTDEQVYDEVTIYFQSSKDNDVIEIIAYTN